MEALEKTIFPFRILIIFLYFSIVFPMSIFRPDKWGCFSFFTTRARRKPARLGNGSRFYFFVLLFATKGLGRSSKEIPFTFAASTSWLPAAQISCRRLFGGLSKNKGILHSRSTCVSPRSLADFLAMQDISVTTAPHGHEMQRRADTGLKIRSCTNIRGQISLMASVCAVHDEHRLSRKSTRVAILFFEKWN